MKSPIISSASYRAAGLKVLTIKSRFSNVVVMGLPMSQIFFVASGLTSMASRLLFIEIARCWGIPQRFPKSQKFQQLLTLPEKDQRAVMRLVNSLVEAKGE
jgi:hypothetical protein